MEIKDRLFDNYISRHTREAILQIETLGIEELVQLIESSSVESALVIVSQIDRYKAARSLEKLSFEKAVLLIEKLPDSVAIVTLRQINVELCNSILAACSKEISKNLVTLLKYPENTVGANLSAKAFTLPIDIKIKEGLNRVKDSDLLVYQNIFILDEDHKLKGVIELKDLIASDPEKSIRSILNSEPPKILADIGIEPLLKGKGWVESYPSLAVVDINGIFLGILTRENLSKINISKLDFDRQAIAAGNALGDLFRIGISGLFRSALEITSEPKLK